MAKCFFHVKEDVSIGCCLSGLTNVFEGSGNRFLGQLYFFLKEKSRLGSSQPVDHSFSTTKSQTEEKPGSQKLEKGVLEQSIMQHCTLRNAEISGN